MEYTRCWKYSRETVSLAIGAGNAGEREISVLKGGMVKFLLFFIILTKIMLSLCTHSKEVRDLGGYLEKSTYVKGTASRKALTDVGELLRYLGISKKSQRGYSRVSE